MAELWSHPDQMRQYFEEIMVDSRGNRAGFPDEIVVELGSLRYYYDKVLFPVHSDVWAKIWSKMD
jgi:hypothetical protein